MRRRVLFPVYILKAYHRVWFRAKSDDDKQHAAYVYNVQGNVWQWVLWRILFLTLYFVVVADARRESAKRKRKESTEERNKSQNAYRWKHESTLVGYSINGEKCRTLKDYWGRFDFSFLKKIITTITILYLITSKQIPTLPTLKSFCHKGNAVIITGNITTFVHRGRQKLTQIESSFLILTLFFVHVCFSAPSLIFVPLC